MQQFKRAKVILLPTEKRTKLFLDNFNKILKYKEESYYHTGQHLYILSDEEIKESDYYYFSKTNSIHKHLGIKPLSGYDSELCKKIIATTDKLNIHPNIADSYRSSNCLPQPSQQFIQKYIESYNKGEIITDVLVEYEQPFPNNPSIFDTLKVNSKDNTITIKKLKESWNSLEIAGLLRTFENKYHNERFKLNLNNSDRVLFIGEFIEENL